jgi:4-oxalocrotonate tautomerase
MAKAKKDEFGNLLKGKYLMPYVNIRITDENVSSEDKRALIAGVTKVLQEVLGKNPATTFVIIDEVNTDNWGIAGEQVTQRRARGQ